MINKITRTSTTIDSRSLMCFAYIILIFFSFMAVASSESSYVGSDSLVSNGLAAYYSFDGGYAQDVSGNGNDGTIMGAMVSEGKVNQALYFDGINDYVNIPRSIQDSFSIVLWVKTTQTSATGHWWAGNGLVDADQCGETDDFGISLLGNRAAFGVGCSSPPVDVTIKSSKSINDGIWHQIAATRNKDTGEIKLYVDGALEATGTGRSNSLTAPPYIGIGNEPCNIYHNRRWFRGSIDEVRIYDRVLSENAILSLFSRPVPDTQPQLSVELFPSTNVAQSGENVPIRVSVTSNSLPVDADVEIKINNQIVDSFSGSDYTYNFPSVFAQTRIGSYDIEATATYNGLIAKDFKKIEVIGDISRVLALAGDLSYLAYAEIKQSEQLAMEREASAEVDAGSSIIEYFASEMLNNKIKDKVLLKLPVFAQYHDDIVEMVENTCKFLILPFEDLLDELAFYGIDISNGKTLLTNFQIRYAEIIWPWQDLNDNRNEIDKEISNFIIYIKSNPEKFSAIPDPLDNDFIFSLYSRPIINVVETVPLISGSIIGSTESDLANYYDVFEYASDFFAAAVGVASLIVLAAIFIVSIANPITFLPTFIGYASIVGPVFTDLSLITSIGGTIGKLTLATILVFMVPPIADEVQLAHSICIDNIKSDLGGSQLSGSLYNQSLNTTMGNLIKFDANGRFIIITPDGRIAKITGSNSIYSTFNPGTYSAIAYGVADRKFTNINTKSFAVARPNVTLNSSYATHDNIATINLKITNHETTSLDNLTMVSFLSNSTNNLVCNRYEIFSLNAGESKSFSYTIDLKQDDVYTANIALALCYLNIIEEKTFSVPIGVSTAEDAAIIKIDSKDEYPSFNNIRINITLQSYMPGMVFNISIPSLQYIQPIALSGTETVVVNLTNLPPDHYIKEVLLEKNGTVLDARVIRFYVRANGMGILTFNTSRVIYVANKSNAINISLKDLNLTDIDAQVKVKVCDPSGGMNDYPTIKTSSEYLFNFLPYTKGTYLLEAYAYKEGWRIDNNTFTVIANQMSPLKMDVTIEDYIVANVTANGQPTACNVTIYTPQGAESTIASNGIAVFNATDQFYIVADKMFFEPAYYSFQPYTLHYPDFTDTSNSNSWRSWLVLQNPTDYSAVVNLTILSRDSTMLYAGIQTIPAHGVSAIRPRNLAGSDCSGSIVIASNQPIVGTCQITRNSNEMSMSYNALDHGNMTLYYPDFTDTSNADSWRSWLVLQNPTALAANITLNMRSRTGDVLFSGSQVIPAHSASAIRPRNLASSDCSGSATITSDRPIVGTCQITRNSNKMCMSYSASDQGATTLYYPDFTDTANPNSWRSWLVLQNPSASPANLSYEIRSRAGDLLFTGSDTIPAHSVNAIRPKNLVGSDCAGSVIVTSDQPIVGTCQITRNSNEMCMSYNALDQASTMLSYPDFTDTANPDSWRSWLVLQNPTAAAANITLEIRSRAGELLYSGDQAIPAHGVNAIRPRNLVGSDCSGSVVVTSDQPIVGTCQISRNNNLMCMSYTTFAAASVDWLPPV